MEETSDGLFASRLFVCALLFSRCVLVLPVLLLLLLLLRFTAYSQ